MTSEEFTRQLPPFSYVQLGVQPPLLFNGVSARVFPLRANLDTLQQLCDQYLNIVPPEAGYFRVSAPYVNLVVLDYGEMGEAVMRTGWFSQTEVYFGISVEWYKRVGGRYVFHDWATITPYIFVNDDISVPVGRTVYGFSKVLAEIQQCDSEWLKNPVAPTTLARIATTVFPKAYTGGNLETRVFLEIQRAGMSNMQMPWDPTNPLMPWSIASNIAEAIGGFGRDAMWMAQAMRIFPVNPIGDPRLMQQMLGRLPGMMAPAGPGFIVNSLNLKQFRKASDPSQLCYQALTNGRMQTTGFNGAGLLGEGRTLLGDLSGGHSILLYEHSSLPIARAFGLDVHQSWNSNGVEVQEFKPVMPFWVNVDLKYSSGVNVAWRTDEGIWRDPTGAAFDPKQQPVAKDQAPEYNNTVSTAIEAVAGPFQFNDTTIRVLPLLADKDQLQSFLDQYINTPLADPIVGEDSGQTEEIRFDVWGRMTQSTATGAPVANNAYVYLTVSSFGNVLSGTDNIGDWAKYELSFLIPVQFKRKVNGNWVVVGVGLLPAYTFGDNCITAISRMEIQGIATGTAEFVRPESIWLSDSGEDNPAQTLLRVDVEVLPALGAGQIAAKQPVIEISQCAADAGLGDAPDAAWRWAEVLLAELDTKKRSKVLCPSDLKVARALALEVIGNRTPFSLYTLKQFRDATDPEKACYQSVVRVSRVLWDIANISEIEETLDVRIFDYPSLNIVKDLGIQAVRLDDEAAGIVYSAQAIRPFYVRGTLNEPLAQHILSRSGSKGWTLHQVAFETLMSGEPNAIPITTDLIAESFQDEMEPCSTAAIMYQAAQRRDGAAAPDPWAGPWKISVDAVRQALSMVDAQTIIESVLSREWSNYNPNARWRIGRQKLAEGLASLPQAGDLKPFAEAQLYRKINNLLAGPPGAVAAQLAQELIAVPPGVATGTEASGVADAKGYFGPVISKALADPNDPGQVALSDLAKTIQQINDGPSIRWRAAMENIIRSQRDLTAASIQMEKDINLMACVAVLGLEGTQKALESLGKPVPSAKEMFDTGADLMTVIGQIRQLYISGEPSPLNNLDIQVRADEIRLGELIGTLVTELQYTGDAAQDLAMAREHSTELAQIVELARKRCGVQREALLNKLSRAYQKPDFCVRRDSLPSPQRDQFLPLTLSWDPDWYYGERVNILQTF